MSEAATDAVPAADEASSTTSTITTLEALQKQSSHSRRLRPPDVHDAPASDEARVPLRSGLRADPEKLSHRESRLGLRGLFARNKAAVQDVRASIVDFRGWPYSFHGARSDSALSRTVPPPPPPQAVPEEQSQAELPVSPTPEPYVRQSPPPPPQAPFTQPAELSSLSLLSSSSAAPSTKPKKPAAPLRSRTPGPSTRSVRGSLATWDPPPLFQAYPQAIKHAQLPICTTSIDVLMRLQGSRDGGGSSISGSIDHPESSPSDSAEGKSAVDKPTEKPKRRHRRNTSGSSMKLEWVSKIYVLVTSGYLLQYAAEGSFDRLPEKILPISRDSAAFASDLIPGRHWVLRVCSSMDADGMQTTDSRSLFSRLPFRGSERRHASTFLMVFEGAEEMESWITILRREIEHLGGKKHLSETGKPKAEHTMVEQRFQANHRTLVVRDPERFSRVLNPHDLAHIPRRPRDSHLEAPPAGHMSFHDRDPMGDDMSTTNSVYSQDGRQLESLRDSGNRFSYISSGQRTVVTSDSSSPPCSPVRDSFASNPSDEQQQQPPLPPPPPPPQQSLPESPNEARLRPNAAAILERRQSMQVLATTQRISEIHLPPKAPAPSEPLPRLPTSSFSITSPITKPLPPPVPLRRETNFSLLDAQGLAASAMPPPPTIPNFSQPHLASKRYSAVLKSPTLDPPVGQQAPHRSFPPPHPREARSQQALFPPSARNSTRRLPPPSLAFSRPLSIVTDHPSPSATSPPLSRDMSNASIDDSNLSSPGYGSDVPDTPALLASWASPDASPEGAASSKRRSGSFSSPPRVHNPSNNNEPSTGRASDTAALVQFQTASTRSSPRRHSSLLALRSSSDPTSDRIETRTVVVPKRSSMVLPISMYSAASPKFQEDDEAREKWAPRLQQPQSLPQSRTNSPSPTISSQIRRPADYKRASMFVQPSTNSLSSMGSRNNGSMGPPLRPLSMYHLTAASRVGGGSVDTGRGRAPLKPEPQPLGPLTHTNMSNSMHLRTRSTSSKAVLYRRSMPQLADGPPPAPPPTCALPPLPSKPSELDHRRRLLQI